MFSNSSVAENQIVVLSGMCRPIYRPHRDNQLLILGIRSRLQLKVFVSEGLLQSTGKDKHSK